MPDYEKFDESAVLDLKSLARMVQESEDLDNLIDRTVRLLRARFVPWQDIADELGVSRQAAQQRYSNDPNPPVHSKTWP